MVKYMCTYVYLIMCRHFQVKNTIEEFRNELLEEGERFREQELYCECSVVRKSCTMSVQL